MKLFLDDLRSPEDCIHYMHLRIGKDNPIYLEEWVVVRNYEEFIACVTKDFSEITHISFDHDLADEHYAPEENWDGSYNEWAKQQNFLELTGYDCAKWMKEFYDSKELDWPVLFCHSQNPVGVENIINVFK